MIIPVAIFIMTIAGKLFFDLSLYFKGGINNHIIGPAIVLLCLTACVLLTKKKKLLSIPMWFMAYWALFDSLYALFIHEGIFYVGTTAKLDILQRHYPVILWLKYIGALGSVIYFIIQTKNKKDVIRN